MKQLLDAPPRTWVFRPDERLHLPDLPVTCMLGCEVDHAADKDWHPEDVWCQRNSPGLDITVTEGADDTWDASYFKVHVNRHPFSLNPALRRPYAILQAAEEQYSKVMGPDELAELIGKFEQHVQAMKTAHAQLVAALAVYQDGGR